MPEHRKYQRQRIDLPVAFDGVGRPRTEALCRDVGLGGVFIETDAKVVFGEPLRLYVKLPGMKDESRIAGIVRWTKPDGMGVQFGAMGARETHALTEMLAAAPKAEG